MEYSLLNLNILRYNDIIIQDNPYHSSKNIKIEAYTTNDEEILIPFSSTCVDNYFDSRTTNSHELDSCHHVHLTNVIQEWNSSKIVFPNGKKKEDELQLQQVTMCSALSTHIYDANAFYNKISQLSYDDKITFNTKPSFISKKGTVS